MASNAAEAMKCVKLHSYDVIFMDLGLGATTGYEVAQKIFNTPNKNQHTPMIALTAHEKADISERCTQIGMQGDLQKPITEAKFYKLFGKEVV